MKPYALIFTFIIFASPKSYSQDVATELKVLKQTIEATHISPPTIDNVFSKNVFKRFIKLVDPTGITLTQQEYAQFKSFETTLDEAYTQGDDAFLKVFIPIFKDKLQKRQATIEKITSESLDFTKNDFLYSVGKRDTIFHLSNQESAYKLTEKQIKYACLTRYNQSKDDKKASIQTFVPQVKGIELRKIKRILEHAEGFERYVANRFLLAITLCYDPHSFYLNKSAMQSFMAHILPEGLSFGLTFSENEIGEIVIEQLIPGSPAWNSNEFHEGDVLLAIQWAGKAVIEFTDASVDEVESVMEQSNQGIATFTIRQKDNKTNTIKLTKAFVRQDENTVKGYMMQGKRKIGYISLPAFYQGCAQNVGNTILKMKKEGVEGVILDIRNNGGGSINESIDLAGIFIEEGAVAVTTEKNSKPIILKDVHRGTIFDEPLIIMVNRYSASASEILAAALQDYNRALIVGSTTYGKATGQGFKKVQETGFVKITELRIYRINGSTAQFTGVLPDINLPDLSETAFERESDSPHALRPDTIHKKVLYNKLPSPPIQDLLQAHMGRMTPSNALYQLMQLIEKVTKISKDVKKKIPLDLNGFGTWLTEMEKQMPNVDEFKAATETKIPIQTLKADIIWLTQDKYAQEMHEELRKTVAQDLHVAECYQILLDWIELK